MMALRITKRIGASLGGLALMTMALTGCYYDNEEELYQYYYENNQCDTANVTFADDIFPIIQGNCAISGCHIAGGAGNGIFENHAGVKAKVDNGSFFTRVIDQRDMPPGAPLNDCQIEKLTAWLNAGAPNN